ncbi:type II secretion system F family protein [Sulfitobacter sabulilitoris]|uniref:Type II secretion system F family protein n=1 Tax=Sulfitobacter sabulilitoris TaxID=2562655 RepID=A0A5S3PCB9_9RHOB|nr:type II secretion system F family protein [Sulfitobacter sabulilitoris]TMM51315.1 type II secretion system F family protein [Sulfitobacter sabulilitoris]
MRAYDYVAFTDTGKRRTGSVVAETEAHAGELLKAQGLFVSEVRGKTVRGGTGRLLAPRRTRLSADLQAVFTRQMAVLLSAELPSEAALDAVRAAGASPAMDRVAAVAKAALMQGAPLSDALDSSGAGFARYYLAALRAGEGAGDVAVVLTELADHLETQGTDRAQIGAALVYPAFVAAVSLLVCAILMVNVAPEIVAMFEMSGRPLPQITRVVLGLSDWVQDHLAVLGAGAAALLALAVASGRVAAIRAARDRVALRLPLIGRLIRSAAAVQYLRTLALVLTSRHAVLSAVDSAAGVLTIAQFRAEAAAVSQAVRSGETLSQALSRLSFLPPVARQLIAAGEVSARLARMADRSAVLVASGLSTERKRIAALIEPLLMMLVGCFVLLIVLAVLLPIFDLQSVVAG